MYVLDKALAHRVEAAEAAFFISLLEALADRPGNPYGAEVRRFGAVVALVCRKVPRSSLTNRIMLAGPGDEAALEEAIAFLKAQQVPVRVDVSPLHQNGDFLRYLAALGLRMTGFQTALFGEAPSGEPQAPASGVTVRPVETAAEMETAARLYAEGFEVTGDFVPFMRDYMRSVQGRHGWTAYLCEVDGQPAAAALLHVADGVGSLAGAATIRPLRGRGAQTTLLRRRIADAAAAGCDLVVSQTAPGSQSQQNMERAGLRIAFTKAEFTAT